MKKKKNPYIKSESLGDSPSLRIPQTCLPSWCCCRLTPHSELPPWGLLLKCSGFRTSRRCWPLILILTQILHSQRHLSSLPRPLTLSMAWFVLVSSQHYSSTETISACLFTSCLCVQSLNRVWLLWTIVRQAPLSVEFSRQNYWLYLFLHVVPSAYHVSLSSINVCWMNG